MLLPALLFSHGPVQYIEKRPTCTVPLIDSKYLSENTSVTKQKDEQKAVAIIRQATAHHLLPIIGETLLATLEANASLTPVMMGLRGLCQSYLALATHYEIVLDGVMLSAPAGTLQADNTAPLEAIKLRREDLKGKMSMLRERIISYMAAHPEFGPAPDKPKAARQFTGLILVETPRVQYGG